MTRGRKRKSEEQQQKCKITIWLTAEEKEKLLKRTGSLAVSKYFRETLLRGRAPKQPTSVPPLNWEAYKELGEHLKVLRQLENQFRSHTEVEQAQALANHTERIRGLLEQYKVSLISLSTQEKGHDSQNLKGKRL